MRTATSSFPLLASLALLGAGLAAWLLLGREDDGEGVSPEPRFGREDIAAPSRPDPTPQPEPPAPVAAPEGPSRLPEGWMQFPVTFTAKEGPLTGAALLAGLDPRLKVQFASSEVRERFVATEFAPEMLFHQREVPLVQVLGLLAVGRFAAREEGDVLLIVEEAPPVEPPEVR